MDPIFNLNAARAKEICRFIAGHNPRRIPIHSEIWAEFVDDELAALMRDAGFHYLEVGLQTTDPTALATTERRLRVERFNEGIAHLQRYRLPFQLQLIYGLPGETRDTFRESLNFAMSLDPPELGVFPLMVLPGTELWRKAAELDLEFDPEPPYHLRSHLSMTADDVQHGARVHRGESDGRAIHLGDEGVIAFRAQTPQSLGKLGDIGRITEVREQRRHRRRVGVGGGADPDGGALACRVAHRAHHPVACHFAHHVVTRHLAHDAVIEAAARSVCARSRIPPASCAGCRR